MINIWNDSEHQELFFLNSDLSAGVPIHIPSALGALSYQVCLRLPADWPARLNKVRVRAVVDGLRPTDVEAKAGDGVPSPAIVPAREPGKVWFFLCCLPIARGDGALTFSGLPAGLPRADLLLCTYPRYVARGEADDWLDCQRDPQWAPSGVPMGGIGCGRVDVCRDGRLRNFSGNNNQDMPFEEPDGLAGAWFGVAANGASRLLATRAMDGIAPCPTLACDLAFPQAELSSADILPDLKVAVRCSSPLIPHDLETSCLPAMLIRWQVHNTGKKAQIVTCTFAWPNLVGRGGGIKEEERRIGEGDGLYRYWDAPAGWTLSQFSEPGLNGLAYGNCPGPVNASADGEHLVAVVDGNTTAVHHDAKFGRVSETLELAPGATANVRMLLVWAMPHWTDTRGAERGLYWQNRFADARTIARHLAGDFDGIFDRAGALLSLMRQSDLPADIRDRLLNCCYPLITNSLLLRDGRFSINEGPTEMSGCFGTIDQRLGAHPATQFLFPDLNRRELEQFAAVQADDGGINHDLGCGHIEKEQRPTSWPWPDLVCSFALQTARHAWTTGDSGFSKRLWPRVRRALERHGRWADEGGGVAQLGHETGLGTSYDSYHYIGTTAYMGTLWIAALQVARLWARQEGDSDFVTRADAWIASARTKLDHDLWNGSFYRAYSDGKRINENCHGGTLAGEYYARLLAGEDVLEAGRLQACADAVMRLNCGERLAVPADETSPDGAIGSIFGWLPYIECFGLAPCVLLRQPRALAAWRRVIAAMQNAGKTPCDTRLMYRPSTGEPSWGAYYMTAPASWLVYDACNDFHYQPDPGVLRWNTQFTGRVPVVHPLFWGTITAEGNRRTLTIQRIFGIDKLRVNWLETPKGVTVKEATGQEAHGCYVRWKIAPASLPEGGALTWEGAQVSSEGVFL